MKKSKTNLCIIKKIPECLRIKLLEYLLPCEKIKYAISSMTNYTDLLFFLPKYSELLFIIDTTASMSNKLATVKDFIKKLILKKYKTDILRTSIILFRDYNDYYVTKVQKFTTDIDKLDKIINKIKCKGGGDIPEAIETAFLKANELNYFENFNTTVFLFTDAYPHLFDLNDSNDFIVDDNEISRIPNWYYEYCSLESKINKLYFINCNTENNPSKYSYEFIEEIINYKSSLILHQKKKYCINYNDLLYINYIY